MLQPNHRRSYEKWPGHGPQPRARAEMKKRTAFAIINNVRDRCAQGFARKNLMFTLATYCSADGMCWPGNRELARVMRSSERTIQRMLKKLAKDGELEIPDNQHGGRGKRR